MTRQDVNQALLQTSFLYGANGAYIEALQAKYEQDPLSVEPGWRRSRKRGQDRARRVMA
jgi:2-oxoglutarate dehydrogenase E1 component